ncbi:hypothetical protein [Salinimicrobium sp. GXAS 041]|uniref:hypothetical protein n=1 Tax=Salinimicrobium sp. GXAS 041 TaxID=3400806 RepID=UPI003C72D37A
MRKLILLMSVFIVFMTIDSSAQISGDAFDGTRYGFTKIPVRSGNEASIEGSAYYHEDFLPGTIQFADGKSLEGFMRYDVSKERIEIKMNKSSKDIYFLPSNADVTYQFDSSVYNFEEVVLNGSRKWGYVAQIFKGNSLRLVKIPSSIFIEEVKPKNGYGKSEPAKFEIKEEFLIQRNDEEWELLRLRHKNIKRMFKSAKAQDYLRNNKIRSEKDLIAFLQSLDD